MPFIILARPSEYNIHKVLQELSAPMLTRDACGMRHTHGAGQKMCNIEITSLKPQSQRASPVSNRASLVSNRPARFKPRPARQTAPPVPNRAPPVPHVHTRESVSSRFTLTLCAVVGTWRGSGGLSAGKNKKMHVSRRFERVSCSSIAFVRRSARAELRPGGGFPSAPASHVEKRRARGRAPAPIAPRLAHRLGPRPGWVRRACR